MCNVAVLEFFIEDVRNEEIKNQRVLEVGSKYVNGSVRPFIERLGPREYIGVDIEAGRCVDVILPAEKLVERFGLESFDVVISTELLEHVKDWRLVINNVKNVLRCGGYAYITTRSFGFPFHSYPFDYWRYEIEDMKKIFSDFDIVALKRDHMGPGVFLKAIKPLNYKPCNLEEIDLYSMILGKKTRSIPEVNEMPVSRKFKLLVRKALDSVTSKMRNVLATR